MSDRRRRPRSRVSATKQSPLHQSTSIVQKIPNTSTSSRRRLSPATPSSSNKRTRKGTSNSKKKEIVYDDDEDDDEQEQVHTVLSNKETNIENDRCAICLDDYTEPKKLDKCSHTFCAACIDHYFKVIKPQCPCCFTIYGEMRGNQPIDGTMKLDKFKHRLPGFENDSRGTVRITYHFANGIQDDSHPNPGQSYRGTTRQAYLPDNREGRHVLKLLEKAFRQRHTFTVGQSRTTGYDNVVTWNDIHHKTSVHGGVENFGYPDLTYLNRVQQELAAKGIK